MIGNELATIINDVNCNWLVSGQDLLCGSTLLKAELVESVKRNYIHVLVVPEDCMNLVSTIHPMSGLVIHGALPTYTASYFPVFTPELNEERISRFLQLLNLYGMSESDIDRANEYLSFICELEGMNNTRSVSLCSDLIKKYSSISAVETVINSLVERSTITPSQYRQLIEKYSEVSPAAPTIENFLNSLNNTFFWKSNRARKIALLGERDCVVFMLKKNMDMAKRKYLFQMIAWDISDASSMGKKVVVTVLESKKKYGEEISLFLEQVDGYARVSLYSDDLFMGHSEELQETIMGYFSNYIYSYHQSMKSCSIISKQCGEIPVVRNSYSCDRDRRSSNNKLIDRMFNMNRVDHYVQHVPVWEPKFREEDIHSMPPGTCLVRTRNDDFFTDIN